VRRRPPRGADALQQSLFAQTAPTESIPVAGYPRRVTESVLRLLGPPLALSFDEAWRETMRIMPAPIGWRGSGRRGEQSPVEFLRARLLLAWEDDDAINFGRDDLASIFDYSAVAARAGSSRAAGAKVIA
jgi:hypothetical protein